jgi:nicotinate phosphoribosyltransferase
MTRSTALYTDRYELTMLDAALRDGTASRRCVFEVFGRRLSGGRRFGVVAGTGRLLEAIGDFRFGDDELRYLRDARVVDATTLDFLADYRFTGSVTGYREGEVYFPGSPLLTVEGTFAEAVLLETLALSILNYDSAVATAAARMSVAAGDRPLSEMGSRRASEEAAVAAARAAYIAGFSATSNLEAGRRWGVPTMGTAAHAWTLLHDSEEVAFRSQVDALGSDTTLLVDTYDIAEGVRTAVRVAGTQLGGVRIDSGDLPIVAREVRALLDELGATGTRITVTSDLDEYALAALAASPVDSYGVGTSVATGSGVPTAGLVFKLVAREAADGSWVAVAKASAQKASHGGRKAAFRILDGGTATGELIMVSDGFEELSTAAEHPDARPLQTTLMSDGEADAAAIGPEGVRAARAHHARVREELPIRALALSKSEPALTTAYREAD